MNDALDGAGLRATKPYLEALNAKGSNKKAPRLDCFDVMEVDVPKLRALHCSKESGNGEDETCVLLDQIQVDIDRLRAQKLVEQADKLPRGEEARALFDRGGRAYVGIFHDYCEVPSVAKRPVHPSMSNCMEMAYNSARAFSAAHEMDETVSMYRALIAFDERAKTGSPLVA